jgi:hypothetical protein
MEMKSGDALAQIKIDSDLDFTDQEMEFLKLIAEIIVELTFKQAYEEGNSLSEI